jgi:hypothetical protein
MGIGRLPCASDCFAVAVREKEIRFKERRGEKAIDWKRYESFGCYAKLERGLLVIAPMLENGERETDSGMIGPVAWDSLSGSDLAHFQRLWDEVYRSIWR